MVRSINSEKPKSILKLKHQKLLSLRMDSKDSSSPSKSPPPPPPAKSPSPLSPTPLNQYPSPPLPPPPRSPLSQSSSQSRSPLSRSPLSQSPPPQGSQFSGGGSGSSASGSETPTKKRRGRPPGSPSKTRKVSQGGQIKPYTININEGQDIVSTLMAFGQQVKCRLMVLTATGSVSNVSLLHNGAAVEHKGTFDITKLSCSPPEGSESGTGIGTLTLFIATQDDNSIYAGQVTGALIAASPVQVIMGSFTCEEDKPKRGASRSPTPPSA